ncbi:MAG: molecular chaperone DnaJ [bacterium]|nr:molecular chaperone DnaJ [bacterium]MDZ4231893.1 molecular chaperone DnaJ [Candidatus Pacearchaeota archaeon]
MKDYYKILGVNRDASVDEIKKAYRQLAHQHHPDKGGDEKAFQEVSEAYQVLSDTDKRAQYDKFGRTFEGSQQGPSGFSWGWGQDASREDGFGFDFDFQDVGDIFEEFFGGNRQTGDQKRGRDIELDVTIPLEAVLNGTTERLRVSRFAACSRCQGVGGEPGTRVAECSSCRGTGEVQQIRRTPLGSFTQVTSCPECSGEGMRPQKPCNVCKGEGRVREAEDIQVQIPPGVDNNQMLRVQGKGDVGRKRGKIGDLYMKIRVKQHPVFERRGDDLFVRMPVMFSQAVLGDEIQVPTLEGDKVSLKVPSGSESGKVIRIAGKGIPHFAGIGRGSMFVQLDVQIPQKPTKQQKDLLERLKKEGL